MLGRPSLNLHCHLLLLNVLEILHGAMLKAAFLLFKCGLQFLQEGDIVAEFGRIGPGGMSLANELDAVNKGDFSIEVDILHLDLQVPHDVGCKCYAELLTHMNDVSNNVPSLWLMHL